MHAGQSFRHRSIGLTALRLAAVFSIIVGVSLFLFRVAPVNATTVALAFLLAILVIATAWGLIEAIVASLVAVGCLNYFFMQPIGTFTIADPQNWVALFAFLSTAIVAGQLSNYAKQRAREAEARQLEMERLYALSRAILLTDTTRPVAKQIADHIAQVFDCRAVALYDRASGETHRAGPGRHARHRRKAAAGGFAGDLLL